MFTRIGFINKYFIQYILSYKKDTHRSLIDTLDAVSVGARY